MPRKAEPLPTAQPKPVPPIGVKISTDLERRSYGIRARARWTDPLSKRRIIRSEIVADEAAAHEFFESLRHSSVKGMDVSMTLTEFVTAIGDRWARGLDPTSTGETYEYGLKLRVLPALGHMPVTQITAGAIDRTIDAWEKRYGASTIKNSIAPLVRVLDEAVRDGMLTINPAKNRAKRSLNRNAFRAQPAEQSSPRAHAIPEMSTLVTLAEACGKVHQSYSDFVMLAALLAARSSEVSGLQAGDVNFDKNLVVIARQTFPGRGGLITKQTKSRKERRVPILDALRPVLERLTDGKEPEDRLLVGPKGGALTTATVRDATSWDTIVAALGLPDLTRHGLRHTGATWMADAGIPLHVLQEILGHASVDTTRGYLHPDDRHLASAAEQANAFLAKATGAASSPKRRGPSRSL
ncbi:tyrosine-type recombinase/integrase [Glaciibacter superstes]|uniref:tyrosine-type recombinase/integrase n=1 Tax=Glaciibacter superstes TaxID=501023 RepID=UPI0003B35193|nr:site-specific integrase [Glaciibacter superstes]